MVEISIDVPDRDLTEFHRVMGLLQTKLGKTPDKAVEMGAVFVARALQASAKVSPKVRRVTEDATQKSRWLANYNKTGADKWRHIPGYFRTRSEAQDHPAARIRFTGLARLLWWKAAAKMAASQAGARPASYGKTDSKADRLMQVSVVHGENASAKIENTSQYAALAFKTGKTTVDTAMRRAANAMRKYVERQTGDVITQQNMA